MDKNAWLVQKLIAAIDARFKTRQEAANYLGWSKQQLTEVTKGRAAIGGNTQEHLQSKGFPVAEWLVEFYAVKPGETRQVRESKDWRDKRIAELERELQTLKENIGAALKPKNRTR